jgi:hypothetical protein
MPGIEPAPPLRGDQVDRIERTQPGRWEHAGITVHDQIDPG